MMLGRERGMDGVALIRSDCGHANKAPELKHIRLLSSRTAKHQKYIVEERETKVVRRAGFFHLYARPSPRSGLSAANVHNLHARHWKQQGISQLRQPECRALDSTSSSSRSGKLSSASHPGAHGPVWL